MTYIAELHAEALEATGGIVAGIPADRWHAATPCGGWDVRALPVPPGATGQTRFLAMPGRAG